MQAKVSNGSVLQSSDAVQQELNRKAKQKERITILLPYVGLAFLVILFSFTTSGRFIGVENIKLLLNQCFTMVIVIIGGAFLYSIGGLDMAIGSVMAVSGMVITLLYNANVPLLLSLLIGILVSIGFMSITAMAKNYLNITPFIASMCVMNVCQGILLSVLANGKIVFPFSRCPWLNYTSTKIIVLVIMIAAGYILFGYTGFGKSLKAIGGNPRVAKISGINVELVTWLAYVCVSVTLTIGALFSIVRGGVADSSVGSGMNLNIMTAIVLGGFPLNGGANARFSAPIIGALTVTVLSNGLALMGYANAAGYLIKGILFIVVVALTYEKSKGKLIN